MKKILKMAFGAVAAMLLAQSAHAGAGANMLICINLTTKPPTPMTVNVTVAGSGTHCMNNTGKDTIFPVSKVGLT